MMKDRPRCGRIKLSNISPSYRFQVILDPKTSRRIFELAKDQQDELDMPEDEEVPEENDDERMEVMSRPRTQTRFEDDGDEDGRIDNTGEDIEEEYVGTTQTRLSLSSSDCQGQEIDAEDMQTLDALLPTNAGERQTLADLIFAKLDGGEVTSTATIQKVYQGILHFTNVNVAPVSVYSHQTVMLPIPPLA